MADVKDELAIVNKTVEEVKATYTDRKIKNQDDVMAATNYLGQVKTTLKNIETKRKSITDPLNASLKEINNLFRAPAETLQAEETAVKRAILDYQMAEAKKIEKKQEKIEAKADAGEISVGEAMKKMEKLPEIKKSFDTGEYKVNTRTVKKVRLVDISKLPVRYLLNAEVQAVVEKVVKQDAIAEGVIGLVLNDSIEVYEEKQIAGGR